MKEISRFRAESESRGPGEGKTATREGKRGKRSNRSTPIPLISFFGNLLSCNYFIKLQNTGN